MKYNLDSAGFRTLYLPAEDEDVGHLIVSPSQSAIPAGLEDRISSGDIWKQYLTEIGFRMG